LTTEPQLDGAALTKLGIDEMRPAELDYVVSQDKPGNPPRPLPAEGAQFLEVSGDDVALVTWKEAEDGKGTILRLQEIGGKPANTTIQIPKKDLSSAQLCSGVEDNMRPIPTDGNSVRLTLRPFEVATVRLVFR
jgi:alpha-mannosidase